MQFDDQPVLVVEDNEDDAFIFGRVFKQTQLRHPIFFVSDGQQAVDYLGGTGPYGDRAAFPMPFLVLLDLKLPLRNGLDVLEWIATQPFRSTLSVVVLTSSAEPRDVQRTHDLGARAYLVKPPSVPGLRNLFESLRRSPLPTAAEPRLTFEGDLFGTTPLVG